MTGTDLPTVVSQIKVKVKVKTAPQQTLASLGFTTARKPLTNPSSPAQVGNHWHVPKYMGESDILTVPGRSRYHEVVDNAPGERLLTPAEVAKLFRVNEKTIRRWTLAGDFDGDYIRTPGGQYRYREAAIRARANPQTSRPGTPSTPPPAGPGLDQRPEG